MTKKRGHGAGKPPKPTALRILHGDFEKNPNRARTREPKAKVGRPVCPKWICAESRVEWKRIVKLLVDLGVLTTDCGPALEQYCVSYKLWRKALVHVEKHGMALEKTDSDGNMYLIRNPYSVELREHASACHRWLTEFGLTPSSRTRIQIQDETEGAKELKEKFLG